MKEQFIRTAMLLGEESIKVFSGRRVAVFGLGGVGGHAAEALARSGIGALDLIDNDVVSITNLNRQLVALQSSLGQYKTKVMQARIADINPDCIVTTYESFYLPDNRDNFPFQQYDYIIDAIDTVTAKIDLAVTAQELGIPIISSMGTGNKLDPARLETADIYATSVCPLAKVMRKELKARGVTGLKVVYSREEPLKPLDYGETRPGKPVPGSTAFVPAVSGLIMAGEVIRDLEGRSR